MSTPHINANLNDIEKTVIMPGDPLRAKYIAENFLDDYRLVNSVRGMYAYTGSYKGKKITVMAHGMGMPSMGIYAYELFKIYNVENIIRIGTCGAYSPDLKLFDTILIDSVYTEGNFALTFNNEDCHIVKSDETLNNIIKKTAISQSLKLIPGNTICTDCFDLYMTDSSKFFKRIPKGIDPIASEMEAFALFYIAKLLNKKAACLISVVDSQYIDAVATADERQNALNEMINIALNSAISL